MYRLSILILLWASLPSLAEEPAPVPSVQITPPLRERISIEPVESVQISDTLRLPGRVALDEHRVARIGPSISGRVVDIRAFVGRDVKKGEVLAMLNSTELSNAQASYLKAKTQVGLMRLTVERARRLFNEGIISEVTLREREAGLAEVGPAAKALYETLTPEQRQVMDRKGHRMHG